MGAINGSVNTSKQKILFFIIFAVLFVITACLVVAGKTAEIDASIQFWMFSVRGDALNAFAKAITLGGDAWVVGSICVLLIILPGRMRFGLPVALMTGIGATIQMGLKLIIERPRPDSANWLVDATGFSFPSGHTSSSLVFYVAIAVVGGRLLILHRHRVAAVWVRVALLIFAVLIAISRPYLGVHYPSDIVGGWLLGVALLILLLCIYDRFWPAKFCCETLKHHAN